MGIEGVFCCCRLGGDQLDVWYSGGLFWDLEMRRFFSFRSSSASSGGKENPAPPAPNDENVYWETPGENVNRSAADLGGQGKSRVSKVSGSPHLRRSLSFSSPGSGGAEGKCSFAGGLSGFLSDDTNLPHQVAERLSQ